MSDQKFRIVLPDSAKFRAGSRTPVKIRNARLSVVETPSLDELISLAPGYYAAETTLPDGSEFEAAFEVPKRRKMKDVELAPSEDQDALAVATQQLGMNDPGTDEPPALTEAIHFGLAESEGDPDNVAGAGADNDSDGELLEGASERPPHLPDWSRFRTSGYETKAIVPHSPGISRVTITHTFDPGGVALPFPTLEQKSLSSLQPSLSTLPDDAPRPRIAMVQFIPGKESQISQGWVDTGGQIFIEPSSIEVRQNVWLRVGLPGAADRNIAIPVSNTEGATFEVEPANQSWRFLLSDPDADAALGYLRHKRIAELAWLTAENGPIWQAMFDADRDRPITGTVGAYALLLTAGMEQQSKSWSWDWSNHLKWSEMLVHNTQAPADSLAIHGELLARQGRYDEALTCFSQMSDRGFPVFSIGLRLVVDRLLSCRSLQGTQFSRRDIDSMIERFGTLSTYVDFDQPILSFTTDSSGKLSKALRTDWELEALPKAAG